MNNTTSGDLLEKLRKAKRTGNYRDKTTTTLLGDLQMKKNDFQGISNNGIYQTVDGELLAKSILNGVPHSKARTFPPYPINPDST